MTIALAGNPNAGKTTLFNTLTGSRQHVGNYPGITVDRKEGRVSVGDLDVLVIDLPGTYSLTAYSPEELVARNVLVEERPDAVVDVVAAPALERNLYLALQFMELGIPVIVALNMMDEVAKKGISIDSTRLETLLGCPVVETVGRSGKGVRSLMLRAVDFAQEQRAWTPKVISYGPDIDPALQEMEALIAGKGFLTAKYPPRWTALKYMEDDAEIRSEGEAADAETADRLLSMTGQVREHCEVTLATSPEALIADYRYGYISSVLKQGVLRRDERQRRLDASDAIDKVATNRLAGPLIMFGIMYFMFQATFTLGEYPMQWFEAFFSLLADAGMRFLPDGPLQSLIVSGIIDGVGGVMSFVPLIFIMFLLISFFEDLGYMARMAYMLDRVLRIFGLHGCSVMPFIISGGIAGGCAVPGIMATRTLRSPKEKLATLLTAPFLTCGAKVPVFLLLAAAFFPDNETQVMFGITLFGWLVALVVARLLRWTVIKGESTPFVMELPPYRLPTLRGVLLHSWERTWQYIKKAGTVILAVSVVLWAAMTYPGPAEEAVAFFNLERGRLEQSVQNRVRAGELSPAQGEEILAAGLEQIAGAEGAARLKTSLAGRIGSWLEPASRLAGFDWRTNIALVGGFTAKEVIVSTLGTAYSLGDVGEETDTLTERIAADPQWTPVTALSLIVFVLIYAPCFVTVVAMARESSWKWACFSLVFNTMLAYVLAVIVYQTGTRFS